MADRMIVVANPSLGPHRAVISDIALPGFAPKGWIDLGPWCGHPGSTLTDAEWAADQAPTVARPPKKKRQPTTKEES